MPDGFPGLTTVTSLGVGLASDNVFSNQSENRITITSYESNSRQIIAFKSNEKATSLTIIHNSQAEIQLVHEHMSPKCNNQFEPWKEVTSGVVSSSMVNDEQLKRIEDHHGQYEVDNKHIYSVKARKRVVFLESSWLTLTTKARVTYKGLKT